MKGLLVFWVIPGLRSVNPSVLTQMRFQSCLNRILFQTLLAWSHCIINLESRSSWLCLRKCFVLLKGFPDLCAKVSNKLQVLEPRLSVNISQSILYTEKIPNRCMSTLGWQKSPCVFKNTYYFKTGFSFRHRLLAVECDYTESRIRPFGQWRVVWVGCVKSSA